MTLRDADGLVATGGVSTFPSFALLQLRNPNDHIQILNERGQCDLLRVDYVQHTPASRISDPMVRLVGPKRWLGLHNSVS